jgi:uncharacterized membrane protein YeaQ/YmgE (transglycosylase-associated protein family)
MILFAESALVSERLLVWVVMRVLTGWLAWSEAWSGAGVIRGMVVGLAGALIGGLQFGSITGGAFTFAGSTLAAIVGACAFILLLRTLSLRYPLG